MLFFFLPISHLRSQSYPQGPVDRTWLQRLRITKRKRKSFCSRHRSKHFLELQEGESLPVMFWTICWQFQVEVAQSCLIFTSNNNYSKHTLIAWQEQAVCSLYLGRAAISGLIYIVVHVCGLFISHVKASCNSERQLWTTSRNFRVTGANWLTDCLWHTVQNN